MGAAPALLRCGGGGGGGGGWPPPAAVAPASVAGAAAAAPAPNGSAAAEGAVAAAAPVPDSAARAAAPSGAATPCADPPPSTAAPPSAAAPPQGAARAGRRTGAYAPLPGQRCACMDDPSNAGGACRRAPVPLINRWEESGSWHGRRRRNNVSDGALLPETCVYCHEEFEVNARTGASPRCGVFHPGHDCAMRALPKDFRPAYDAATWRAAGLGQCGKIVAASAAPGEPGTACGRPYAVHGQGGSVCAFCFQRIKQEKNKEVGKVTKLGQLGKRKAPKDHRGKRSSAK
eukprot:jgi/Tetstr1/459198/TSEL_004642.t1